MTNCFASSKYFLKFLLAFSIFATLIYLSTNSSHLDSILFKKYSSLHKQSNDEEEMKKIASFTNQISKLHHQLILATRLQGLPAWWIQENAERNKVSTVSWWSVVSETPACVGVLQSVFCDFSLKVRVCVLPIDSCVCHISVLRVGDNDGVFSFRL